MSVFYPVMRRGKDHADPFLPIQAKQFDGFLFRLRAVIHTDDRMAVNVHGMVPIQ